MAERSDGLDTVRRETSKHSSIFIGAPTCLTVMPSPDAASDCSTEPPSDTGTSTDPRASSAARDPNQLGPNTVSSTITARTTTAPPIMPSCASIRFRRERPSFLSTDRVRFLAELLDVLSPSASASACHARSPRVRACGADRTGTTSPNPPSRLSSTRLATQVPSARQRRDRTAPRSARPQALVLSSAQGARTSSPAHAPLPDARRLWQGALRSTVPACGRLGWLSCRR